MNLFAVSFFGHRQVDDPFLIERQLDKSGSYIRGITSGAALPSLRELFNIISYFDMTPAEFFAPLDDANTPYRELCEKLRTMNEEELEKVSTFIGWIEKKE